MSALSSWAWLCTASISRTTSPTTLEPSWAMARASSEDVAARPAFLATSSTVAFISSMAVAVSATRWACCSEPRLDCSTWAESSSDALLTTSTTPSSWAAA